MTYGGGRILFTFGWDLLLCGLGDALGSILVSESNIVVSSTYQFFLAEPSLPVIEVGDEVRMRLLEPNQLRKAVLPLAVLVDC